MVVEEVVSMDPALVTLTVILCIVFVVLLGVIIYLMTRPDDDDDDDVDWSRYRSPPSYSSYRAYLGTTGGTQYGTRQRYKEPKEVDPNDLC